MTEDLELMGTAEVAVLLGVSRQRVLAMVKKKQLPDPLATLTMGYVWRGDQIRRWAAERRG